MFGGEGLEVACVERRVRERRVMRMLRARRRPEKARVRRGGGSEGARASGRTDGGVRERVRMRAHRLRLEHHLRFTIARGALLADRDSERIRRAAGARGAARRERSRGGRETRSGRREELLLYTENVVKL